MNNSDSYLPTQEQEWLLRAALLQGQAARDAWQAWKSSVDIDRLDQGSFRLLPLLHRNLSRLGVQDALMTKFKGIYRKAWYKNQMLFHDMAVQLCSFHAAGIRTMLLKGAALILLHYKDYGLRPMEDFDVLVPPSQALQAISILKQSGWTPMPVPLKPFSEDRLAVEHAHAFKRAEEKQFDLHWYLLFECCYAHADDDLWDGAVPVEIHGVSTCALNPTDLLLHICLHGTARNPMPTLRWAADAATILYNAQDQIDWKRLIAQAEKRRLVLTLRESLDYLNHLLNSHVPAEVFERLDRVPISKIEQMEHDARARPLGVWGWMPQYWFHYLRSAQMEGDAGWARRTIGFARFLQRLWGLDHLWQVPFYGIWESARKVIAYGVSRSARVLTRERRAR